jgi:hypothetical protein
MERKIAIYNMLHNKSFSYLFECDGNLCHKEDQFFLAFSHKEQKIIFIDLKNQRDLTIYSNKNVCATFLAEDKLVLGGDSVTLWNTSSWPFEKTKIINNAKTQKLFSLTDCIFASIENDTEIKIWDVGSNNTENQNSKFSQNVHEAIQKQKINGNSLLNMFKLINRVEDIKYLNDDKIIIETEQEFAIGNFMTGDLIEKVFTKNK